MFLPKARPTIATSGMGVSERDIKKYAPGAILKKGLPVTGSQAANSEGAVKKWLAANGLI